jgi:hypothetical protein
MLNYKFEFNKSIKVTTLTIVLLYLIIFSLIKPIGFAPDYFQYIYYFDEVRNDGLDYIFGYRFEVGFGLLVYISTIITTSSSLVYSFLVGLSSFIKIYIISLYSKQMGWFLAILLFIFKYFLLQDNNQLRAALSIGFVLL